MKNRIVSFALALLLAVSVLCPSALASSEPWYADAFRWAASEEILDSAAEPNAAVTRAEAVTLLWKAAGSPAPAGARQPFSDVGGAEDAVLWAYENGITDGTAADRFSPALPVTRAQAVTFLYRYIQQLGGGFTGMWMFPLDYDDAAEIPDYAYEAFCYASMKGIVGGAYGKLAPRRDCRLSEFVAMLFRFAGEKRVDCGVYSVNKYGNVVLDIYADTLLEAGYAPGDIVTVHVGGQAFDMPIGTNYSDVDAGSMVLRVKDNALTIAVNQNSFAAAAGLDETSVGAPVTITMQEKEGYLRQYVLRSMAYTNAREDYASDEVFANFRAVNMGRLGYNVLYRSASGIDDARGRAAYVSALYEKNGIKTVVSLSDGEDEIAGLIAAEGFDSPYYKALFERGDVVTSGALGIDITADAFKAQLAADLREMTRHEAPYAIHCLEGKDRTGFALMLLEALMGASYGEMLDDYMLTYENYYHLEKGGEQYQIVKESNADYLLMTFSGLADASELEGADFERAAEEYLTGAGMTEAEIAALKTCLSGT